MAELCKHFGIDFYLINDWDLNENLLSQISEFRTIEDLHESEVYNNSNGGIRNSTEKAIITTNWKLLNSAINSQMHFNYKNLEEVLGYSHDDKDSLKIWTLLNHTQNFDTNIFPESLHNFLEIG